MVMSDVWLAISLAVPLILAAIAGGINLVDAKDAPPYIRPFRLFQAVCCYYFVLLYAGSAYGLLDYYFIKAGYATRIGVSIILLMIIAEVMTRHRRRA